METKIGSFRWWNIDFDQTAHWFFDYSTLLRLADKQSGYQAQNLWAGPTDEETHQIRQMTVKKRIFWCFGEPYLLSVKLVFLHLVRRKEGCHTEKDFKNWGKLSVVLMRSPVSETSPLSRLLMHVDSHNISYNGSEHSGIKLIQPHENFMKTLRDRI